jgi:penicillin-binding protein 2
MSKLKCRFTYLFLLFSAFLVSACGGNSSAPRPEVAAEQPTLATPLPTEPPPLLETLPPGPTAVPPPVATLEGAEAVAWAFYRAWEERDYPGMYRVLSPESQAAVDSRSFVSRYQEAMTTATVQSLQAALLASRLEDEQAHMTVRVTWQTAVAGEITRDHPLTLVYHQRRWGIVWHDGLILPELQAGRRLHLESQASPRANIYDVHGRLLAYQGTVVTLGVVPGQIADENGLLAALSRVLNRTPQEIKEIYAPARPDWYWPIADITGDVMQDHINHLRPHIGAGLTTSERPARLYPQGNLTSHIVGYTGFIPAEQLARYQALGYQGGEQVGLTGIEAWGESHLSGIGGTLTIVGPAGERLATIPESESSQALPIYLTIDLDFQRAVAEALAAAVNSHPESAAGTALVLDVATGKVLAMASFPTYDPVVFDSFRLNAAAALGEVLRHPGRPLFNRATQGEYPPGSTFKIVTMAAALNSGLYTPASEYTSTGSWNRLGDSFIKYDWLEGGHGTLNLVEALSASCNSCFYDVSFNLNQADPYLLPQTARAFGFGATGAIQGLPEAAGLIPDPAYKVSTTGRDWEAGDAVNMGIGQGDVLATPLQLARLLAAIANGGALWQATLIDRMGGSTDEAAEAWPTVATAELPLTVEELEAVRAGLWGVANSELGTATERFRRLPVPVAGKTGTTETIGLPHSFFAGYAPAAPYTRRDGTLIEEPEIAIVVLMEHAGEGSEVAAPVFRRIVELYYGITPPARYPWQ